MGSISENGTVVAQVSVRKNSARSKENQPSMSVNVL
jgi:hypothetical protein